MNSFFHGRQEIENREKKILAPFATFAADSRGREFPEKDDPQRTIFQRDRDRVIHCRAYRRLKGKTQVFVAHHGDHFRNRLTHTMEVAQLSRDIARNFAVNEDLAETIALSHDLGHTPFGHAGQDAMAKMMQKFGAHFEHNEQSRRVVEVLEKKSPHFPGLNLSWEVRDGLQKHRNIAGKFDKNLSQNGSLEAQIVDLSDQISYLAHDLDDGLRGGILSPDELSELELWREVSSRLSRQKNDKIWISAAISALIKKMTGDLFAESAARLQKINPKTVADIRAAAFPAIAFSPAFSQKIAALRKFLFEKMYKNPSIAIQSARGQKIIEKIFSFLLEFPDAIPDPFQKMIADGTPKFIAIKDFIAGMTDDFAIEFAQKIKS